MDGMKYPHVRRRRRWQLGLGHTGTSSTQKFGNQLELKPGSLGVLLAAACYCIEELWNVCSELINEQTVSLVLARSLQPSSAFTFQGSEIVILVLPYETLVNAMLKFVH